MKSFTILLSAFVATVQAVNPPIAPLRLQCTGEKVFAYKYYSGSTKNSNRLSDMLDRPRYAIYQCTSTALGSEGIYQANLLFDCGSLGYTQIPAPSGGKAYLCRVAP